MEELTDEQIVLQKTALVALKQQIETTLARSKEAAKPVELDQQAVGRLSRIDAIQQQKMVEANRRRQHLRLKHVKAALSAIVNDHYGICRRCEEYVAWPRLRAQPECFICLHCKASLEKKQ